MDRLWFQKRIISIPLRNLHEKMINHRMQNNQHKCPLHRTWQVFSVLLSNKRPSRLTTNDGSSHSESHTHLIIRESTTHLTFGSLAGVIWPQSRPERPWTTTTTPCGFLQLSMVVCPSFKCLRPCRHKSTTTSWWWSTAIDCFAPATTVMAAQQQRPAHITHHTNGRPESPSQLR